MSIKRPGIHLLNPYINTSDSLNVSQGNPNLEAVKTHIIDLNYSYFNPKINISASLTYKLSNNGIEKNSVLIDDITYTIYDNIGQSNNINTSLYINWSPTSKLTASTNLALTYYNLKSNNELNLSNDGFTPRLSANIQYELPWKINTALSGTYYGGVKSLESENTKFYYYNISFSKTFIDENLNIRIFAANPFPKYRDRESITNSTTYYSRSVATREIRNFGISVSYKFGNLKNTKKTPANAGVIGSDMPEI